MKLSSNQAAIYKNCTIYKNQDSEFITVCNGFAIFAPTLKGIKKRIDETLKKIEN